MPEAYVDYIFSFMLYSYIYISLSIIFYTCIVSVLMPQVPTPLGQSFVGRSLASSEVQQDEPRCTSTRHEWLLEGKMRSFLWLAARGKWLLSL